MEIRFLGHASFKLSGRKVTLITDPFDPDKVGFKYPKQKSEIVTISHEHDDHNRADLIEDTRKVINGPGEYEIEGVSVIGIRSYHDKTQGSERGKNTMYVIEMDGLRLAHLGDLGHELSDDLVNQLGEIDILMVPVGGVFTIDPKEAAEVIMRVEPKIVLPMHYKESGMSATFDGLATVEQFLTTAGLTAETVEKLSVKEGGLPEDEQVVYILSHK